MHDLRARVAALERSSVGMVMTWEEAEALAAHWRKQQESTGHAALCDYDTGENVFEADDFRKWALENLSATITVDGEDVWLSGAFGTMLLAANASDGANGPNGFNGTNGASGSSGARANGENVLYRKEYANSSTGQRKKP